jgi:hypothetical protein
MSEIAESTLVDLYNSAVAAFPKTRFRQHATQPIVIARLDWTPYLGLKTLFVKGLAQNEGREYTPLILFKGVRYHQNEDRNGLVTLVIDDRQYLLEQLSMEGNEALVRCNCPDFKWRFNYFDHLDRSLYGVKRAKYEAKLRPGTANPLELPGMCKHLMKLSQALSDSGIIV